MAAEQPRHDADAAAVAAAWGSAGSNLDEQTRRTLASAVLVELGSPARPADAWLAPVLDALPALDVTVDECRRLREAVDSTLLASVPAEVAVALQRRVAAVVDDVVEVSTRRRLAVAERSALVDPLTGLDNRRSGEDALARAVAHARRHDADLAVAVVDLDGLKQINDRQGHLAGDDALRLLSTSLQRNLRAGDRAFRFGGDEFVVLAPDTSADDLAALFERVRAEAPAFTVGIANVAEATGGPETLLPIADARLYETRRIARVPAPARRRWSIVAVAVAIGVLASLAGEAVRRAMNADTIGAGTALWAVLLGGTPILTATLASRAKRVTGGVVLRRVAAGAGGSLLVMTAALTPILAGAPDGPQRSFASSIPFGDRPTTTFTPPSTTSSAPTTSSSTTSSSTSSTSTTAAPAPPTTAGVAAPTGIAVRPDVTPVTAAPARPQDEVASESVTGGGAATVEPELDAAAEGGETDPECRASRGRGEPPEHARARANRCDRPGLTA